MRGLMSERPLLIATLIEHAARYHGDIEIVSHLVDRSIHRYTYAEAERRSRRLARGLLRLGIAPGQKIRVVTNGAIISLAPVSFENGELTSIARPAAVVASRRPKPPPSRPFA